MYCLRARSTRGANSYVLGVEVRRSAESRGRSSLPDPFCGLSARDELLCPGPTERFLLVCQDGVWRLYTECVDGDVCTNDGGARCAPIVAGCEERSSGEVFCDGSTRRICSQDLLSTEDDPCEEGCGLGWAR